MSASSRRAILGLGMVTLGVGGPSVFYLQGDFQGLFLPVSPAASVRCLPDSTVGRTLRAGQSAYRFHIGAPALQIRDGSGALVAAGPAPRVVAAVFDTSGAPIALADSVLLSWGTTTGLVQFDARPAATGWGQTSTIDSAAAMAIAVRLGPKRIMEAVAEAQKLERRSPRQALDSLAVGRARALAAALWTRTCPNGRRA
jgi:hypothetical protein